MAWASACTCWASAILVDGQATACCVDAEGEICLGNAREQTVEEIWEGEVLTLMRYAFWNELRATEPRCVGAVRSGTGTSRRSIASTR